MPENTSSTPSRRYSCSIYRLIAGSSAFTDYFQRTAIMPTLFRPTTYAAIVLAMTCAQLSLVSGHTPTANSDVVMSSTPSGTTVGDQLTQGQDASDVGEGTRHLARDLPAGEGKVTSSSPSSSATYSAELELDFASNVTTTSPPHTPGSTLSVVEIVFIVIGALIVTAGVSSVTCICCSSSKRPRRSYKSIRTNVRCCNCLIG